MTDSAEKMLSVRVPEELHRLVSADSRTNQELVRAALWREFGGERVGEVERRIEEKRDRINAIEREKNERERELAEKREDLKALEAKREKMESDAHEQRREQLQRLQNVPDDPDHPLVQDVAEELGMDEQETIEEANNL